MTSQVSVAAPKSDRGTAMTSEEQRRLIREEKERDYWMMKDLEEGVVDWLSDSEYEEPEMNPKYDYDNSHSPISQSEVTDSKLTICSIILQTIQASQLMWQSKFQSCWTLAQRSH